MSVKIISKLVKICSFIIFPMCFIVKIFFDFIEICSEQIFLSLIIHKSSRRAVLTIANARFTLCAESLAALTSFVCLVSLKFWKKAAMRQIYATYL